MYQLIKKFIPQKSMWFLRRKKLIFFNKLKYLKLIIFDIKRFNNNAYDMNDKFNYDNLRSKITFHYHSLEKGLSNKNFRYKFGINALNELFYAMDLYIEKDFPLEDSRFQQAICVLEAYLDVHREQGIDVKWVEDKYNNIIQHIKVENNQDGGFKVIDRPNQDNSGLNFKQLMLNRHSVRDFGEEKLNENLILDSISIASLSPSVCNRQSCKVHLINDKKLVHEVLLIQGGLTGFGENIQKIILVTSDKSFMNGPHERNQTYVDGGIFFMNLLNALTYNNIATCSLNADFDIIKEKKLRNLMDLKLSEDLIGFIALGSFPSKYKIAFSPRDTEKQITKIYD